MDTDLTSDAPGEPLVPLAGAPAAVGEVVAGRWSVSQVRRGGQSWVLVVDDLEQGGRRAIKTPLAGAFAGDAELAMLLDLAPHPHVVSTLDVIQFDGRSGIVLEYAPSTLTELIGRGTTPSGAAVPDAVAAALQQVCAGMRHLSAVTEVAHLDLKPSNVLIDGTGRAKIADFGLARQISIRHDRFPSAQGGTWAYAAPEVLRQEPSDTRADIFSFGVLLYEACTGRLPYPFPLQQGKGQRAQLLEYYETSGPAARTDELYYWSQFRMTQVPVTPPSEGISLVLAACLDRFAEQRPRTFDELADLLARGFRRPLVDAEAVVMPEVDQRRRVLTLARVLIRLGRHDEAVNRLNRLLSCSLPPEFLAQVLAAARDALTGAGRHAEANALAEW